MTTHELWRSLRFLIAVPAMILGGLGALAGAFEVVLALFTGHQDPYHGGAMLLASGAGTLGCGVVLMLLGLWARPGPRDDARFGGPAA